MVFNSRSRSFGLPLLTPAAIIGIVYHMAAAPAFVQQPPSQVAALRGAEAVVLAAVPVASLPMAAQAAADVMPDFDSTMNVAGTIEPLMFGLVLGLCPTTLLGLMVAAWLQFKKGPTLGV